MARRSSHTAIAVVTTITLLVSVAVLTLATAGTPSAQAAQCRGGGGSPSPSPSASPSGGGGINPTAILTLLPGGGGSPSSSASGSPRPSGSPSPRPSGASPSNTQTSNEEEQRKREIVPVLQQDQTCKSTITISYSQRKKAFGGRVKSEAAECKGGRKVQVKKFKRGKDPTVGRAVTNARGVYTVPSPNARGRFYAVAAKANVENDEGGTTTCQAARSKTIRP